MNGLSDDRLREMGRALASAQDDALEMRRRVWRGRMKSRLLEEVPTPWIPMRWMWGVGIAVAGLALFALGPWTELLPSTPPPEQLDGVKLSRLPSLEPSQHSAPGSVTWLAARGGVRAMPGAKIDRVSGRTSDEVVLEEGRVHFSSGERLDRAWNIEARGVRVRAEGASFWVEVGGTVHVEVETGDVEILRGSHVVRRLHAGEEVTLKGHRKAAPVAKAPKRASGSASDWQSLAREGRFSDAWEDAQRHGIRTLRETLGPQELLRLADIARFTGHTAQARQVLLTVRERFEGTEVAANAAFDLARVEPARCGRAQDWLRTYLREQRRGTMAVEASARLRECEQAEPRSSK